MSAQPTKNGAIQVRVDVQTSERLRSLAISAPLDLDQVAGAVDLVRSRSPMARTASTMKNSTIGVTAIVADAEVAA